MKPRAAYIDHSYHKRTQSTKFFMDLLSAGFDVDLFWDESWNNGRPADFEKIAEGRYDAIVLFQTLYPAYVLKMLNCDTIILIPMYDNVHDLDDQFWSQYRGLARFMSFSRTLHDRLSRLGLASHYAQYFMEPRAGAASTDFTTLRGFFWQRQRDITWRTVRRLIKKTDVSGFYLHGAVDPGFDFYHPSKRDVRKYNIQTTEWFQSKREFSNVLKDCNLFFASRLHEGIGMSFIEAMAMGQCVAAPDSPTMNEYIVNGATGLLYDINRVGPLDFKNAGTIGGNARDYCAEGFRRWNSRKGDLLEFMHPSAHKGRLKTRRNAGAGIEAGNRKALSRLYSTLRRHYELSESVNRENIRLKAELNNLTAGYSYRLGRLLLAPVRALYAFVKKSAR